MISRVAASFSLTSILIFLHSNMAFPRGLLSQLFQDDQMYPGWIFWQSDRDVQVPNRGLLYPWQVCKGIQRLLFCLACNQAFYLLLRCVRRGTIEKIEKDQPV